MGYRPLLVSTETHRICLIPGGVPEVYLPTHPLRELMRIRQLQQRGDVHALIEMCRDAGFTHSDTFEAHVGHRDWRCKAAAEALATLGAPAVQPVKQAILKPDRTPPDRISSV